MSEYNVTLNVVAGGSISPSRFVKGDTTTTTGDLQVLQCSATTDLPIGISGTFTVGLPIAGAAAQAEAAATGDNLLVYPVGCICLLEAGTGGWGPFTFLSSDTSGRGIPATSGKYAGALSLGTVTTAGQLGRVLTLPPQPATAGAAPGLVLNESAVKTSAYTITATDEVVLVDPTSAGFTVTLPTAVGVAGKTYILKNVSTSTNTITMASTSSQTIDTASAGSTTIAASTGVKRFISDGANWFTW